MEDNDSASAEIETQDNGARAEIETEDKAASIDIENPYSVLAASIDIENPYSVLVSKIAGMLERSKPSLTLEHCIYRVPEKVRKINEEAYTPRLVAVGPLHHGRESLESMEVHKLSYFKTLLERGHMKLEDCVGLMKKKEEEIRRCYAATIDYTSDDFVMMILVDGGFIVELLLRCYFCDLRDQNDSLLQKPWMLTDLDHDLILLENQLPFILLEELFNLIFASFPDDFPSLLKLSLLFFRHYNKQNILPNFRVRHFTDLIRTLHLPMSPMPRPKVGQHFKFLYSATALREAGVTFKVGSSKSLLDIKFTKGVLEIPCFKLYDKTESVIRNLMSLEQCHYPHISYIIDYILLMDNLINTPKDVDLLVQNGIIVNWLGESGTAATFFNNLCRQITVDNSTFYFSRLCEDLNAYYKAPWHRWKATLKRDYFSTPWRMASPIVAVIFLVLTFVQTICSIMTLKGL